MTRRLSAGILALALIAGACGDDNEGGFSTQLRDGFMDGCTESGSEAFCLCYLDELGKRFTEAELFAAVIEGSEEPPEGFIDAGLACASELDG